MRRNYMAILDDGHDYIEFKYTSSHRLKSKANMEDCKEQYTQSKGYSAFKRIIWERFDSMRDDSDF